MRAGRDGRQRVEHLADQVGVQANLELLDANEARQSGDVVEGQPAEREHRAAGDLVGGRRSRRGPSDRGSGA
jgi:hypothetical protein